MSQQFKSIANPTLIAALASLLVFPNLSRSLLWQDEAQTALLARTTLQHGIPIGHDGANSLSQEQGRDIDSHDVFRYHPWVQFYITAASFALFGESTFTARLPFALLGVATVVLTYYTARSLWRSEAAAVIAALFLTCSVPFLLLVRQCRYYSPLAFFLLLAVFAYLQILSGRRRMAFLFAAAVVGVMHSLHLYALVLLAVTTLHTLVWHRDKWKDVLIPAATVLLLHVPWFAWVFAVAKYTHPQTIGKRITFCIVFAIQTLVHILTPVPLIAYPMLRGSLRASGDAEPAVSSEQRSAVAFLLILIAASVLAVSVTAPGAFVRYLAPLPPLAALLAGPVIPLLAPRARVRAGIVAVLFIGWYVLVQGVLLYPYELFTPYRGPIRGIVEFLNSNAHPGDIAIVQYGDMPLKFYTKLRVVGGLTGEDLEPGRDARFVIFRKHLTNPECDRVAAFMKSFVTSDAYEEHVLDCPDLAFENREDMQHHIFLQPHDREPVTVFERRE